MWNCLNLIKFLGGSTVWMWNFLNLIRFLGGSTILMWNCLNLIKFLDGSTVWTWNCLNLIKFSDGSTVWMWNCLNLIRFLDGSTVWMWNCLNLIKFLDVADSFLVHSPYWSRRPTNRTLSLAVAFQNINPYIHKNSSTLNTSTMNMEVAFTSETTATMAISTLYNYHGTELPSRLINCKLYGRKY
jgi:hypothetical protein